MATSRQRAHMKSLMLWLLANEPAIDYVQRRPMATRVLTEQMLADTFARGGKIQVDCSEMTTMVCRLCGLADPNGLGYNGSGFTGTMLRHLPHYTDPEGADVGALVVFVSSAPQGDHVAQVVTPGVDPWLFSHGSTGGPKKLRLSTELAAQRQIHGFSNATFLNISDL